MAKKVIQRERKCIVNMLQCGSMRRMETEKTFLRASSAHDPSALKVCHELYNVFFSALMAVKLGRGVSFAGKEISDVGERRKQLDFRMWDGKIENSNDRGEILSPTIRCSV